MSSSSSTSNTKNGASGTSSSGSSKNASKDPVKALLKLARQNKHMAERQHLLLTFLQMGASLSDVKEVYEMRPYALNRDVLFEAGKLQVAPKVLKFLLDHLSKSLGYEYYLYNNPRRSFTLKQDPHLLTDGNVTLGLQQVVQSKIAFLKVFAPESGKPFWTLKEFVEFFSGEVLKSPHIQTLCCTFPIKDELQSAASTNKKAASKPTAMEEVSASQTQTVTLQQPAETTTVTTQAKPPKPHPMAAKIKARLQPKKLEQCILEDVRIKAQYAHKTSDSLLQLVRSLANLPKLKTFALQIQKDAISPKGFKEFKQFLPEAVGKLIVTCKTLENLILDAADLKKPAEWDPLWKALEKNPPLQRLWVRGFQQKISEAAVKALPKAYKPEHAVHTVSLESVRRNLLAVLEKYNTTLTVVRFVIPECRCDSAFQLDGDDCFLHHKYYSLPSCTPAITTTANTTNNQQQQQPNGTRYIPPPKCVPELDHFLAMNAHGRAALKAPRMTHNQWLAALTSGNPSDRTTKNKFPADPSIVFSHLRNRPEYVAMLYSLIRSPTKQSAAFDMEELHLAAQGVLALPLERFVELCARRIDDVTAIYSFLQVNPTMWLHYLQTAKQIVKELKTQKTKKHFAGVVELTKVTRIVQTGTRTITSNNKTTQVPVYKPQAVVLTQPRKVIRLNVAPSVDHSTLTKFPKLAIGGRGRDELVAKRKKKAEEDVSKPAAVANSKKKESTVPSTTTRTLAETTNTVKPKKVAAKKQQPAAKSTVKETGATKKQTAKSNAKKTGASSKSTTASKRKVADSIAASGNNKAAKKGKGASKKAAAIEIDDDSDDDFMADLDASDMEDIAQTLAKATKVPRVRRRSAANSRRAGGARKKPSNNSSSLNELIGEESSSDEDDCVEKGGADSDWDRCDDGEGRAGEDGGDSDSDFE
ncbi:expressed unknown protein [Seminavis robusta]|uniref:Uncharacterized protein n=1 Tax=Seminavis robusta TaxID=568900 RepID=A0A9N8EHK1_9STRA|nr:expressed unknown protein [Seminavis robusta]|eukprot:Sro963_g225250.1 n/a (926) ;mRNA; f:6282-9059